MFKKTKICSAAALALGGALSTGTAPVFGQQQLERVEITGSSIRRIEGETALPVQVLKRADIERSGATTVVDLLQKLPSIQGSFGESSGVGGTGGFSSVSIHNIGDTRTLVLLNGHRLAIWGGQLLSGFGAGIDLNSLPLAAIDRVEILTDGASALYGSDAIAGVVNFITRRNTEAGDISFGISSPREGGARETRISATVGIGSIDKDGFNVTFAASHDDRTRLDAVDRKYGKTGQLNFSTGGKNYRIQQFSGNSIPANTITDPTVANPDGLVVNPYLIANNSCPAKTFRVSDSAGNDFCGFDFVGELEIYPIRNRDTLLTTANKRIGDHELFLDVLLSKTEQVSRIAPVPGPLLVAAGTPLHNQYLVPIGITQDTLALYRLYDLGKRENKDLGEFEDIALGSKGVVAGWDYTAGITHSKSDARTSISGYPGANALARLQGSGALDPFVGIGQQSAAGLAAINAANFKGYWDGGVSKLDTIFLRASRELIAMPAGPLLAGAGVNYNKEKFQSRPSLFAQGKLADPVAGTLCDPAAAFPDPLACDTRFGDEAAVIAYSADRKSYGLFGEFVIPVVKGLEVTPAIRFDHYSDFGNTTTAKASLRWTPVSSLLVRGSVGTGFHAPTVPQINAARQPFGVTSGDSSDTDYNCALNAALQQVATGLGAQCRTGGLQYDVIAGGNKSLIPEKSRQASLGVVFEPASQLSLGADLWHVGIRDTFGQLNEAEVFANPAAYPGSWTTKVDPTGTTYLAFFSGNQNLGKSYYTGIDLNLTGRAPIGGVTLTSNLSATYMLREVQQTQRGGQYFSAIGNFAELGTVTFRWQGKWTNTVTHGHWAHTFGLNFKSGYRDAETTVDVLDSSGTVTGTEDIRLKVKSYATLDWQTQWSPIKNLSLTVGLLNLFDKDPPLSISSGGLNRGQQFGYDDRYYDSRGRTLYFNASAKF
jgi:iron complex outermembrane recepter protein